ncbi:MAG: aldolase/citrate lyase family protein [Armatimonadetes bacterium]|nr:aldolase/citrate lyase family protein [Armatimonadota bacterium]
MAAPRARLKSRMRAGEVTIGSWLSFGYTPVCEIMTRVGFDWLVIDMEHTAIDTWQMMQLIQVIDLSGCVPLVRVGANDPLLIKRALDAGAHGVVVPMVNSAEEAARAVSSAYYPPRGTRGVGLSRAQDYGVGFEVYNEWAGTSTVVIVQIEHIRAVENLAEIVSVEGVDGFIVGPYDLSGSLGLPGQFDHPKVISALNAVRETMSRKGVVGGYHVVQSDHKNLQDKIAQGYRFLAYGDDMVFLAEKLREERDFIVQLGNRRTPQTP